MRCFIGIELPVHIRKILYSVQKQIGSKYAKIKWVAPKNMHITLHFLGEVDDNDIVEVKNILSQIKSKKFAVCLDKIGWFPNSERVNVLWVGLKPEKEIFNLHGDIEIALKQFLHNGNSFSVHITIGRIKVLRHRMHFFRALHEIIVRKEEFEISHFSLIKSELSKDGPRHIVLEQYPFL